MAAHILLSPVGQKTETRFNCLLTENRKSTEMMVEDRCYQNDSWSARRVIGATAKPLYPIDGKAAGFDQRNPKTSLFEGGGPPQRWKESADGGRSPQTMIPPRSPTPHSSCEFGFFFICIICPKHMMFSFKNHQVSFRRMSRSSACFFHRINVF